MITYTYSEARQNLATLLDNAKKEGEILIIRRDGSSFMLRPILSSKSPLEVAGIDVQLSSEEIVNSVREIFER